MSRWTRSVTSGLRAAARMQDTNDEFHQLLRKDSVNWVRWAISHQVWLKVREVGKPQAEDFTLRSPPTPSLLISVRGLG